MALGLVFFFYSLSVLVERLDTMGFSVVNGLEFLEEHHHMHIDDSVMDLAEESEIVAGLTYTIVSLQHYFLHGYHQFFLLEQTFDLSNATLGATQFYPIAKFMGVVGLDTWSATELESILEEPGVYYTFFGQVYMDFGYWGFLYCFLIGLIAQMSWNRARIGDTLHRMVYPFLAAVMCHSSYLNMFQSGQGVYLLFALLVAGGTMRIVSLYGRTSLVTTEREASWTPVIARK